MKRIRKIFAVMLSAAVLVTLMPLYAGAEESDDLPEVPASVEAEVTADDDSAAAEAVPEEEEETVPEILDAEDTTTEAEPPQEAAEVPGEAQGHY